MSLKSFLSQIWADIKSLFEKLPGEIQLAAQIAVTITESIKTLTDLPVAGIITMLIPGDIDDKIKTWLNQQLPDILTSLRLVEAMSESKDPDKITASAIKIIQSMDKNIQSVFLHDLGVLIAQEITKAQNSTLNWSDGIYIIEWYYQHKLKTQE
jgi:hypothetical protein